MTEPRHRAVRWVVFAVALAGLAAVFIGMVADMTPRRQSVVLDDYQPWRPATIRLAETLPVQDGGRVKPLSTMAGFTLLRLHGARTMRIAGEGGRRLRLGPTEWLLDCLFRPRLAVRLPTFRIDNAAVLEVAGIPARGKRDRYSYNDLEPARARLLELAGGYEEIPDQQRAPVQRQVLALAYNLRSFEALIGHFSFARGGIEMMATEQGGAAQRTDLSTVMATAPVIREVMAKAQGDPDAVPVHVRRLVDQVIEQADFARYGLAVLAPAERAAAWRNAGERIIEVLRGDAGDAGAAIGEIKMFERLARAAGAGEDEFAREFEAFKAAVVARAAERGEVRALGLEASYYRANWLVRALGCFIAALLSGLGMWLAAGSRFGRVCGGGVVVGTAGGLALTVVAIVQRSLIMGRPPIGNLYDTIPFITAAAVAVALVIEWTTRRRFALGVAPVLGVIGLTLARRFEIGDAQDHMDPLVAVLDSNFWLTVHVITITLGYSAGLLSAALSHGYLLMRGLGLDGGDHGFRRSLTRATYGTICLTLFLSLVGTVLGGIWANDSWGRFWGWDPKENGALMIVLWNLAILHARLGGLLGEWLLHLASVCGACVIAFSWWHVNFLGVGLHNYGFTSGKAMIWAFYAAEAAVIIGGVIARAAEAARASRREPATQPR